ncbi:hypothetical protein [Dryocola sp. BD613]|uniref:hypothetical protein n=1 Tax=Dryocola sp. BD613 TaxID=3133272 RepID=UPI003F50A104
MNDQPGNVVTQAFAWLATLAAGLGITTQDMVYMIFGLAGLGISVASYINARLDAYRKQKEDEKRTQLLQDYLAALQNKNGTERLTTAQAVSEAIRRAGD